MTALDLPDDILHRVRTKTPLVQCITNFVAMDLAANLLLAVGASPAMIHAEEEAGEFAAIASALTVNIGTISADWVRGMQVAAATASRTGLPWVLDPVGCGATRWRTNVARELASMRPTLIRGNASEIIALAADRPATTRGVDASDPVEAAREAAGDLARRHGSCVAVTGEVDYLTDGTRQLLVAGGHAMMAKVTAMGCALTAVCGATLAVEQDPFMATAGALTCFKTAGSRAAAQAEGPGSLRWRMADELFRLEDESLKREARLELDA